jgi:hypothetical protein
MLVADPHSLDDWNGVSLTTAADVAAAGGLTVSYVCKLLQRGTLRGLKVGRVWYVDRDAALRWLARPRPIGRPRKGTKLEQLELPLDRGPVEG